MPAAAEEPSVRAFDTAPKLAQSMIRPSLSATMPPASASPAAAPSPPAMPTAMRFTIPRTVPSFAPATLPASVCFDATSVSRLPAPTASLACASVRPSTSHFAVPVAATCANRPAPSVANSSAWPSPSSVPESTASPGQAVSAGRGASVPDCAVRSMSATKTACACGCSSANQAKASGVSMR